jgi:hypothetical protein
MSVIASAVGVLTVVLLLAVFDADDLGVVFDVVAMKFPALSLGDWFFF